MKFYLVLYLLTSKVAAVIHSVAWKEVLISEALLTFTSTLPVSAVREGGLLLLVCAVEGGYGLSEKKIGSDYYEKENGNKYKCWSKFTMRNIPVKLEQDGLYYQANFRIKTPLNGEHCILSCRRIAGYRLAIARTDDQLSAILADYVTPFPPTSGAKYLYMGLVKHQVNGEEIYKWTDGTPYNLTVNVVPGVNAVHFILKPGFFRSWTKDNSCLCQGNPSLLDW